MLTSKQRAYLRSLGNEMEPIFHIGKGGLSEESINQLDDVLEARELVKVSVLKNCLEDPGEIANEVAEALSCDVVQKIGRRFLVYRQAVEEPQIELP